MPDRCNAAVSPIVHVITAALHLAVESKRGLWEAHEAQLGDLSIGQHCGVADVILS